jgi:hypothetical protein
MDTDTIQACRFAAEDERGKVRQGSTDGNSESDADTRHMTTFLISKPSSTRSQSRSLESRSLGEAWFRIASRWSAIGFYVYGTDCVIKAMEKLGRNAYANEAVWLSVPR